jgi:hypothetical protein
MSKKQFHVLSLLLLILLTACGNKEDQTTVTPEPTAAPAPPPPPPGVTAGTISLGKAVGPDKKVTAATESFAKGDTIYASVDTTGSGTATLKATWTYLQGGQTAIVNEESQTISGPATTEFHISKPGGWPAGDYQVEVFLDGSSIGTKRFKVG